MADTSLNVRSFQRPRIRVLVVPREHGAWGLLLVPLFTGAAVGVASTERAWPLILFTVRLIPALVIIAFIPGLIRGFYWFFAGQKLLQMKRLGWTEMRQGVLFGILLAAAIILS